MTGRAERPAPRVACASMTDPAWSAVVRRDPSMIDRAVVLVDVEGPRATVIACSPRARQLGVREGQRGHRARAIAPSSLVQVEDPHARAAAREALYDAATSLSPSIEPEGDRVLLDASGVRARFHSEEGFAAALSRACEKLGLSVAVAVAGGRRTATAIARETPAGQCVVVAEGSEREALAGLSLRAFELPPALRDGLTSIGILSANALAAMDTEALASRLGAAAADAVRLARGEDRTPVLPRPRPDRFEERASFEWELIEAEPLLFACRRLVDAALARLACRSLSSREARVSLALRGGGAHERTIAVGAPTREGVVWLRLLRASLEASPPPDAVVGARVDFQPCAPRAAQLGLFDPPGPAPERWSVALARIEATVGAGRVGAPCEPSTHRPGEVRLAPFDPRDAAREVSVSAVRVALSMHVFRPPRPARVRYEHGAISALSAEGISGRVLRCAGPYRRAGAWWNDPFAQDSWDVALEDQTLYRVAYDGRTGAWTVDGRYE